MPRDIPDLWGEVVNLDTLSPRVILNAQAELLKQKTGGIIRAQVEEERTEELVQMSFDLRAPASQGYRARLLRVAHVTGLPYPCIVSSRYLSDHKSFGKIVGGGMGFSREELASGLSAATESDFVEAVRHVFQSQAAQGIIQSLIAVNNELTHESETR